MSKNIKQGYNIYGFSTSWDDEDGSRTTWNHDQYMKVYRHYGYGKSHFNKKENGLREDLTKELENKKIIFSKNNKKDDDKERFVQAVYQHWDKGYYLMILYYTWSETQSELLMEKIENGKMYGKSHGTLYWKNINSHCPFIQEYINENKDITFE